MAKYLYGASVQGIQGFIFETNKLREIVGASELVEQICKDKFEKAVRNYNSDNLIIGAAGNIKYLFDNKSDCEKLVLQFPKTVMESAPGITISQAVEEIKGELTKTHIDELEKKLKIQRNKPVVQHGLGFMITERARRTGKSGVSELHEKVIDDGIAKKTEANKENSLLSKIYGHNNDFLKNVSPEKISEIANEKEWIAVIHADGNNLGKLIQSMSKTLKDESGDMVKNAFREFSLIMDKSTVEAVRDALDTKTIVDWDNIKEGEEGNQLPFRPIILGGDDLLIIIKGDLAIEFTKRFLKNFEQKTSIYFKEFGDKYGFSGFENGITACAGIAFTKSKYPFHYGSDLAEHLCSHAKKISKHINDQQTPSSLIFHKVHSSFTENYSEIINRELTVKETQTKDKEQKKCNIRFDYGPYFLNETCKHKADHQRNRADYITIDKLQEWVKTINEVKAPKSDLRNWLNEISESREKSEQLLHRIKRKSPKYFKELQLNKILKEKEGEQPPKGDEDKYASPKFTHIFDMLSISNINKK